MPRAGRPDHDELNNPTCRPLEPAPSGYPGRGQLQKRLRKLTNPELQAVAADVTAEAERRAVAA